MLLSADNAPATAATTVLTVGESIAVLISCRVAERDRDAVAATALQAATGRQDIEIGRRPSGRPRLSPPHPELGVSLARRGSLLLAGFSPAGAVGVDLELPDDGIDPRRLARDHYSLAEARAVGAVATDRARRDLFLRLWVAKEAALKATGRGIYDGADEPDLAHLCHDLQRDGVVVSVRPGTRVPAVRLAVRRVALADGAPAYCALALLETNTAGAT